LPKTGHGRQLHTLRQSVDLNAVEVKERVRLNIYCVYASIQPGKPGRNIFAGPDAKNDYREAQRAGRCLNVAHFRRIANIG
jgi:hypothetical protein